MPSVGLLTVNSRLATSRLAAPLQLPELSARPGTAVVSEDALQKADYVAEQLPVAFRSHMNLLAMNILSAVKLEGAFDLNLAADKVPTHFTDTNCDPAWWPAAGITMAICDSLGINLCSYAVENEGELFVHLVPTIGDSPQAKKSRGAMRGHTDGVVLPLPWEVTPNDGLAPSPDLVILVGLRNSHHVATRLAPISAVIRKLAKTTLHILQEPLYDISPQISFRMPSDHVRERCPVIVRDQHEGYIIRFSHGNVSANSAAGVAADVALVDLKDAISTSFENVVVKPGDILFVNNRTSLHGREEVMIGLTKNRWLLRSYGLYSELSPYLIDAKKSNHMLLPARKDDTVGHRVTIPQPDA